MLTPMIFRENLFDDWMDDFWPLKQLDNIDRKLYGKRANREMLTDVKEFDDHYQILIDLPGFKKEDVNVELENGYLTIRAEKGMQEEEKNDNGKLVRQERYTGSMSRSFYVGEELAPEEISASFDSGVLTLNLKKTEAKAIDTKKQISIE